MPQKAKRRSQNCPCGSGKSYGDCCGNTQRKQGQQAAARSERVEQHPQEPDRPGRQRSINGGTILHRLGLVLIAIGIIGVVVAVVASHYWSHSLQRHDSDLDLVILAVFIGVASGLIAVAGAVTSGFVSWIRSPSAVSAGTRVGSLVANAPELREYKGREYEVTYVAPVRGRRNRTGRVSHLLVRCAAATPITLHFARGLV